MHRRVIFPAVLTMLALLTVSMLPANAWVYPDSTSDAKWEGFGPRADKMLINLYADDTAEFAALEAGIIDILDWPIPKAYYVKWTTQSPYKENIKVVNYGPEFGLYIVDMNSNDNQYLGNPPNPAYPNPVADRNDAVGNPDIKSGDGKANNRNPMSNVWLRRAIAHLIDRAGIIALPEIGAGFGFPMYTTMPPGMAKYLYPLYGDLNMPWAWKYDPVAAAAMLTANGFPINGATGKRYWDRNGDGVEQDDEYVELIQYYRSDHPGRRRIGEILNVEMTAINLRVNSKPVTSGIGFVKVMVEKNFHMYTGGWSLGVDPDHLILWAWDYYWHPGFSYNYGGHNDAGFNDAADGIMYANTQDEAVYYAYLAQYRQAYMVLSAPVYCVSGNKAYSRTYVGTELDSHGQPLRGKPWQGIVSIAGYGIDNGATFNNMHPNGSAYDLRGVNDVNPPVPATTTIRWGFKVPDIKQLNPVYASWLFDWNVLDLIYGETLVTRNASDLGQFLPNIAKSYEVGTYIHPIYGESSKIRFSLRTDVSWSDGYALTVADVHFTFVELKNILIARGLPYPWWWSSVQNILSFSILDPSTFEVLLDVKSYWALGWVGTNIILPKHIWKPIAETGDPQAFAPDPNLIGNGAWRFVEYVEASTVLLVANRPGRTVKTALPGSTPIKAKDGYVFNYPVHINVHPLIKFNSTIPMPPLPWPVSEVLQPIWHEIKGPEISTLWRIVEVDDNGNGIIDQSDWLNMTKDGTTFELYHVFDVEWDGKFGYIKVDWWVEKIPAYGTKPYYLTPVELGVTIQNLIWADEYQRQPGPNLILNKYVYIDGQLIEVVDPLIIEEYPAHHKEEFNLVLPKCMHTLKVAIHIKGPTQDSWSGIVSRWLNYTFNFWITVKEDITGGTLDYYDGEPIHPISKAQMDIPDCKVNIRDVSAAARAFGSYPGHARWNTAADLTGDYKVNIRDISAIAKRFGWA